MKFWIIIVLIFSVYIFLKVCRFVCSLIFIILNGFMIIVLVSFEYNLVRYKIYKRREKINNRKLFRYEWLYLTYYKIYIVYIVVE